MTSISIEWNSIFLAVSWVLVTLLCYTGALKLYQITANVRLLQPLTHPLITSSTVIIALLYFFDTPVKEYQSNTYLLTLLLGPATVALALPLYNQFSLLLKMGFRVIVPIMIAAIIAPVLSWLAVYLLDAPLNLQLTMLTKSITTPLAMDTAEAIGGIAPLAAIFVITTGIIGAVFGPFIFKLCSITNHAAQGLALGSVAHAIGTARAISISEQCTAFSTLALCINGIVTSIMLPLLFA